MLFLVIKQRMQVFGSPYKTCLQCGRSVYKREGVRAYYRSFSTQVRFHEMFCKLIYFVELSCNSLWKFVLNIDNISLIDAG